MDTIVEYILANYTWILLVSIIILLAIIGWYADKTNFGQGKNDDNSNDLNEKTLSEVLEEMKDKRLMDNVVSNKNPNNEQLTNQNNQVINLQTINQNIDSSILNVPVVIQPINKAQTLNKNIIQNNVMNFDPITGEPIKVSNENGNKPENIEMNFDSITSDSINTVNDKNNGSKNVILDAKSDLVETSQDDIIFGDNFDNFEKRFNEVVPQKEIIDEGLLEDIENIALDKTQKININEIPDLDDIDLPRIKQIKTNDKGVWKF